MKAYAVARSCLVVGLLVGCSGLDPQRFAAERRPSEVGGQAGYSYDAGVPEPSPGGAGGRASGGAAGRVAAGGGATKTAGTGGVLPDAALGGEGGEGDEPGKGGSGSEQPQPGGHGGTPVGGAGAANGAPGGTGRGGSSGAGGASGGQSGHAGAVPLGGAPGGSFGGASAPQAGSAGSSDAGGTGGVGGAPATPVHALVFTEYVEGSASYKALELFAAEASTLDGCRLVTYANGSGTGSGIALTGSLPAGAVYTLCSTTLADLLGTTCDRTTNLAFNGNDAVALECNGALVDVLGEIGVDPGTAWTGPSSSTVNATLRRRCDHLAADADGTDPFDPDVAFTPLPVDTFDGLGDPACG